MNLCDKQALRSDEAKPKQGKVLIETNDSDVRNVKRVKHSPLKSTALTLAVALSLFGTVGPARAANSSWRAPYDFSVYCSDLTGCGNYTGDDQGTPAGSVNDAVGLVTAHARDGHLILNSGIGSAGIYESRVGVYFSPSESRATTITVHLNGIAATNVGTATISLLAGTGDLAAGNNFIAQAVPRSGLSTMSVAVPPFKGSPRFVIEVSLFNGSSSPAGPIGIDVDSITATNA